MKKLTFSKSKFESKIIAHFEECGVYDHLEKGNESFKLWFEETVHGRTYQFDVEYDVIYDKVYYHDEIICTCENKPIELTLKVSNYNPNKPTLYDTLQSIIEKQQLRDEENKRQSKEDAKDIDETNDILSLKNR